MGGGWGSLVWDCGKDKDDGVCRVRAEGEVEKCYMIVLLLL